MAVCLGTITFAPGAVLPRGQLISLGENHVIRCMAKKALLKICLSLLHRDFPPCNYSTSMLSEKHMVELCALSL